MRRVFVSIAFSLCVPVLLAQSDDLEGDNLRSFLRAETYQGKHQTLSYRDARVAMYGKIDNQDGSVVCVYGGFEKAVAPGGDVSSPMPMNCEHTIPQSFFNKSLPMRSDIHHLFPTFKDWNSNRSNFPFAEIDDSETSGWMLDQRLTTSVPGESIDDHSEVQGRRFEPPEDHKGNVARAVFYFYTMYPTFERDFARIGDLDMFMAWHVADPPDETEKRRNDAIEEVQGNRNPFVDRPALAMRAWPSIDRNDVAGILAEMGLDPELIDRFAGDAVVVVDDPDDADSDRVEDDSDPIDSDTDVDVNDNDSDDVDPTDSETDPEDTDGPGLIETDEGDGEPTTMIIRGSNLVILDGKMGIGTEEPSAALDVHGEIFLRGQSIHADFVFTDNFQLPSISEHARAMWQNRHLPSVAKAKQDASGQDVIALSEIRKGVLTELEIAHIYIEQLHLRLNALEKRLAEQADMIHAQQKHLDGLQENVDRSKE